MKTKKILMYSTLCILLIVGICITTVGFVAKAESCQQQDGQYVVIFERTDWTSLTNTDHNPLGTYSGKYENINVGLHSDGLQISTKVLSNYLISVGYASGEMQWGNDVEFILGGSEHSLPAGFLSIVEPNKEYTINSTYSLFVRNQTPFEFPFQMIISYTNVNDTTITLNYKIVYSYLYMQPFAQYGVALPEKLAFEIIGLESTHVTFNYIDADFGISNLNRGYNVGSTFGFLPEIPKVPNYVLSYYWAYAGALDVPLTVDSVVENKAIYAVYTVDMSRLSNTAQSLLQSYYNNGYDKGVADGISQGNVIEKPLELWGGIFSQIGSFFNIELLPNVTIGTLLLIPTVFIIVLVILKLVRG